MDVKSFASFFSFFFFCRYMKPTWLDFFFLSFSCFLFLVHWKLKMNKNNPLFELCHHADHFVFAIALSCLSATFAMHSGCAYLSVWYLEQLEEMFNEWDSGKCHLGPAYTQLKQRGISHVASVWFSQRWWWLVEIHGLHERTMWTKLVSEPDVACLYHKK